MTVRTLINAVKRRFENTWHKAHVVAGICDSPNLGQVRDLLEHGEQMTKRAKTAADFAKFTQVLGQAGEDLSGAADAIDKIGKQGSKVAGDVSAACEISEAVTVLMDWGSPGSRKSSPDAAKAFDKLFGGAARYMGKLPFPANQYAEILSAVSKYSFFSNMQNIMDPESPDTPRGRQMRELNKEMGWK
jgi:hypothetical protein